jgi:hypothetical protein
MAGARLFRYEHRGQRPIPRRYFARRLVGHLGLVAALLAAPLAVGMLGYVHFEHLAWTDAFLNSAMLLGGMGPVNPPVSEGGKVFAGVYALFAGLLFLVSAGVIVVPVVHRVLHRFHWDESAGT